MGGGFSRAAGVADGELGQLSASSYSHKSMIISLWYDDFYMSYVRRDSFPIAIRLECMMT